MLREAPGGINYIIDILLFTTTTPVGSADKTAACIAFNNVPAVCNIPMKCLTLRNNPVIIVLSLQSRPTQEFRRQNSLLFPTMLLRRGVKQN